MLSLTDEQKKVLMEQAGNFLQQVQQGKSARDIMAQIYVDGLDNKTLSQGQVMADAIMESVNAFDCDYAEAKDDLGAWLDRNLKQLAQGKTAAERCAMWMKIAVAVNAVSDQEHPVMTDDEKKRILEGMDNLSISEEEATAELEAQLYREAKSALENSSIMLSALVSQREAFRNLEAEDDAAELLLDFGSREMDFRSIASMIAYVNVKNGTFDNIPVDMKLEQITTMVCAEVEQLRILDAVNKGKLPLEVASALLKILGAVCMMALGIRLGVYLGRLSIVLQLGILTLPAVIFMVLAVGYFLDKGLEKWCEASDNAVKFAATPIKAVAHAVQSVASYLRENVLPQLRQKTAKAWERLKRIMAGLDGRKETGVTEEPLSERKMEPV